MDSHTVFDAFFIIDEDSPDISMQQAHNSLM